MAEARTSANLMVRLRTHSKHFISARSERLQQDVALILDALDRCTANVNVKAQIQMAREGVATAVHNLRQELIDDQLAQYRLLSREMTVYCRHIVTLTQTEQAQESGDDAGRGDECIAIQDDEDEQATGCNQGQKRCVSSLQGVADSLDVFKAGEPPIKRRRICGSYEELVFTVH